MQLPSKSNLSVDLISATIIQICTGESLPDYIFGAAWNRIALFICLVEAQERFYLPNADNIVDQTTKFNQVIR